MSETTELVRQLVAIDSVNPDLVPGGAGEGEIARFVATWLERAGLDVTMQNIVPGRSNVIGVARGTGGGQSLLLNAHMDTVGIEGIAAHGSRPDLGLDAIARMGKVLVGLEALDTRLRATPGHHLVGTGSVHASLIEGGQELSSYPRSCRLRIERRTIPGETRAAVEAEASALLAQIAATDPTFKASLKTLLARNPFEIACEAPIVQTVTRHAQALLGRDLEATGAMGWMDSALLSEAGIPTVIFGPGGAGAHAAVEWSDLEQVEQATEVLTQVAREFCQ